MPKPDDTQLSRRDWRFESIEERLALSADPVADFWIDPTALEQLDQDLTQQAGQLLPQAAEGHGWSDVAFAREQLGLRGGKQTVAVIDSGIAWDHMALGGGLGSAYRVVGGWDFAENDANPYDDGPAGFHGTHVTGIIGARDAVYSGVAPDVDLVGLRVFDDAGNGYFTWVESALRYVHQYRNAFENPITTVNLSLGTDWNAHTLPQWATLEEEFAQLASDGIFVSVAAGNSFLAYGTAGLSYPAVSQWVTPVASVDASGNLSRFSQRADRVLAAPGERIMSTLPDHFFGGDGYKNDWGATSGTSMAAPYVAGASVLVREAMTNLGNTNITPASIYQHLYNTADLVYDSATNASYHRVNLQRAFDTLVGADDFGGSLADAGSLGTLTSTIDVSGTIGRTSDRDFFRFTARQSGTVTLDLASNSHLAARWDSNAGGQVQGSTLSLAVVAGQTYTVGIAGSGQTIGKYTVELHLEAASGSPSATPWGTVQQARYDNLPLQSGDAWFRVTAGRTGAFTVEALFPQAQGNIELEIYDAQQRLIASGNPNAGGERVDFQATAGTTYFVRARGTSSDVDFRLTNLVSIAGSTADILGTEGNDSFSWNGVSKQFTVNGVEYALAGKTTIRVDGRAGSDSFAVIGASAAETATLRPGSMELVGGGLSVSAQQIESLRISGGAGDRAYLYDSAGNDTLEAMPSSARLTGSGYDNRVDGFKFVQIVASSGYDRATLRDSAGMDYLDASSASVWLRGSSFSIVAAGFDEVDVHSTAGTRDMARLVGTAGSDTLSISGGSRRLSSGGVQIRTENFQSVQFAGGGGFDTVELNTNARQTALGGSGRSGWAASAGFTTEFVEIESLLANVRSGHRLSADLEALDYVFRRLAVK